MTEELNGRRIVVPETRELGQLVRMLEAHGAEAIPCPMIAIRDAPDAEPVAAWLRWFVKGTCDDLVLMTGEGLRRLLGLADASIWSRLSSTRSARRARSRAGRNRSESCARSVWTPIFLRMNPPPKVLLQR